MATRLPDSAGAKLFGKIFRTDFLAPSTTVPGTAFEPADVDDVIVGVEGLTSSILSTKMSLGSISTTTLSTVVRLA